jgi:hypothetical protein
MQDLQDELICSFNMLTAAFQDCCGELNTMQLYQKPNPDKWSIAQHLQHIMLVNGSYFPVFQAIKDGTYSSSKLAAMPFLAKLIGRILLKEMNSSKPTVIQSPILWQPDSEYNPDILSQFISHQIELIDWIAQICTYQDSIISSPANKLIIYSVYDAIQIILAHEKRHLQHCIFIALKLKP